MCSRDNIIGTSFGIEVCGRCYTHLGSRHVWCNLRLYHHGNTMAFGLAIANADKAKVRCDRHVLAEFSVRIRGNSIWYSLD